MRIIFISLIAYSLSIPANSQTSIRIDYFNKANKLLVMSDYKNAELNFIRAIEFYQLENDTEKIVDCKLGIATIKYLEGNYVEAVELYENLRANKSILLNENQREAIKSSISICKEIIKTTRLKN